MDDYPANAAKQDPESGTLAQRTIFPADSDRAWRVFARTTVEVPYVDVADWVDLGPIG